MAMIPRMWLFVFNGNTMPNSHPPLNLSSLENQYLNCKMWTAHWGAAAFVEFVMMNEQGNKISNLAQTQIFSIHWCCFQEWHFVLSFLELMIETEKSKYQFGKSSSWKL